MNSVLILVFFDILASSQAAPDPATNLHINKAIIDLQDSKDQDSKVFVCLLTSFPFVHPKGGLAIVAPKPRGFAVALGII